MTLAASIDAIEYVETVPQVTPSPLDGTPITTELLCDCVRVTLSVGELVGHLLYFKPEAIADRMHGYSLAEELHAVEALVRECVFAWSPQFEPADPANRVDVCGGVDERIAVTWSKGTQDAAAALLKGDHAERIAAHAEAITAAPAPVPEPVAEPPSPSAEPPAV